MGIVHMHAGPGCLLRRLALFCIRAHGESPADPAPAAQLPGLPGSLPVGLQCYGGPHQHQRQQPGASGPKAGCLCPPPHAVVRAPEAVGALRSPAAGAQPGPEQCRWAQP